MPQGIGHLVGWLVREWQMEIPERLHDFTAADDGAPQWSDEFRAYLTAHPLDTDKRRGEGDEGAARRLPIHAALYQLAGRGDTTDAALMARFLFRLACSGGDWQQVCDNSGIPPWVAAIYTTVACRRLWTFWDRDATR